MTSARSCFLRDRGCRTAEGKASAFCATFNIPFSILTQNRRVAVKRGGKRYDEFKLDNSTHPNSLIEVKSVAACGLLIAFALLLAGCAGKPLVSVGLFNRTGGACRSVDIEFNGHLEDLGGNVPNGNSGITGGWPYPMPTNATLRWVTEDQNRYAAALTLPKPSVSRAEFLDYDFVILPDGRAKVIVLPWSGEPTDTKVEHDIVLETKLCCDGGPNYRVAVKNTTGFNVDNLDVRFGPYAVNAGTHLSGTGQNYSIATGLPYPIAKSASLRWTTGDGHSWNKVVDLKNSLPSDPDGKCFWFILREQGNAEAQIVEWSALRAGKYPDLCRGF